MFKLLKKSIYLNILAIVVIALWIPILITSIYVIYQVNKILSLETKWLIAIIHIIIFMSAFNLGARIVYVVVTYRWIKSQSKLVDNPQNNLVDNKLWISAAKVSGNVNIIIYAYENNLQAIQLRLINLIKLLDQ